MKASRLIFLLFFLVLTIPGQASSLHFRINKSNIDTAYRLNGSTIDYCDSVLNSGAFDEVHLRSFSSPDGPDTYNIWLSRCRADSALTYLRGRYPSVIVIIDSVQEDWDGVAAYLRRGSKPWKDDALAIISAAAPNRKQLLQELWVGEAWEDLVKNCFPRLRRVELIFSSSGPSSEGDISGTANISFRRGYSFVQDSYASNSSALNTLKSFIREGVHTLYIYSYSSPDGSEAANASLSRRRAESVKSRLLSYGFTGSVEIIIVSEDWDGLTEYIRNSSLVGREDALEVLEDGFLTSSRKKALLHSISNGSLWRAIIQDAMPALRRVVVTAES